MSFSLIHVVCHSIFSLAHQAVITCVADAMQIPAHALNNRKVTFLIPNACGALAIIFIRHLVWAEEFPKTFDELQTVHLKLRHDFAEHVTQSTPRPWIWGAGDDGHKKLHLLLQDHGVADCDVSDRIQMIYGKLGKNQVQDAMTKPQPWKELQMVGQSTDPGRSTDQTKWAPSNHLKESTIRPGRRDGKLRSRNLSLVNNHHPRTLDPALLRIEQGVFVCGHNNTPLGQLMINQMGPNANGYCVVQPWSSITLPPGG